MILHIDLIVFETQLEKKSFLHCTERNVSREHSSSLIDNTFRENVFRAF